MAWTDTHISTVVLVKGMYNVANCRGGILQISVLILI